MDATSRARGASLALAPGPMRWLSCAAIAVSAIGASPTSFADTLPTMDHDRPVVCMRDLQNEVWRIQCNHVTRVCLYAPDAELASDGSRNKPLQRARPCAVDGNFDRAQLEAQGYTVVAGRADAPWGWT